MLLPGLWIMPDAIALVGVDEKLSPATLAEIAALPQVREAKALVF